MSLDESVMRIGSSVMRGEELQLSMQECTTLKVAVVPKNEGGGVGG